MNIDSVMNEIIESLNATNYLDLKNDVEVSITYDDIDYVTGYNTGYVSEYIFNFNLNILFDKTDKEILSMLKECYELDLIAFRTPDFGTESYNKFKDMVQNTLAAYNNI